jgi:hypothetical protein
MIQAPTSSSVYQANILTGLQQTGISNTSPGGKARAFCDAVGDVLGLSEANSFSALAQTLLPYATGSNLDYIGAGYGLPRLQRVDVSTSTLDGNFEFYVSRGTFGSINNGQDIIVPAGTQIYTTQGLTGPVVLTTSPTVCPSANTRATFSVVSLQTGSGGNTAASVFTNTNFIAYTDYQYGSLLVTNNYGLSGGRDAEEDDDYRYRISLWLQSNGGAAQSDIRLAVLAIPGVANVTFETQAGTYLCYIYGTSPQLSTSLLKLVQTQLDATTAYPLFGTAIQPDLVGISLTTTLSFASSVSATAQQNALSNAQTAASNYINNLNSAQQQEFVINALSDVILQSDSNILDIGNPNQPLLSLYIWRSRSDGSRYSRNLIADYTPQVGENVIVETSISNPINITISS